MGSVDDLKGKLVGLDTAPLIYFMEKHIDYVDRLRRFFMAVESGEISVVTSVVTLTEVLVHPILAGDEALANAYQDILLHGKNISTLDVTDTIAQTAAELRAEYRLKTPDAIQLSTAMSYQAEVFLTNDRDYGEQQEIEILRLCDLVE